MDLVAAQTLIRSLVERLEADARAETPRLTGLVSSSELAALRVALDLVSKSGTSGLSDVDQSPSSVVNEGRAAVLEVAQTHGGQSGGIVNVDSSNVRVTQALNEAAFARSSPEDQHVTLCIDFGTAKSKAFAASDEEEPQLFELGLGKRDGDVDGSVYAVSSSIWIDENGLMFVGSRAVQHGRDAANRGGPQRERLDSIKQELSQIAIHQDISQRRLEPAVNPSGIELTYDDALTFLLGYLTDLAAEELAEQGVSRYVKRRFTLPWWAEAQRLWAARTLSSCLARAQVLADTFSGRWNDGIPVVEVKQAMAALIGREDELTYLLDQDSTAGETMPIRWGALLEPLAAGSGRIWADRSTRDLVLIIDVGAGTTDFSLFWVVQNQANQVHRAFPVYPCGKAIRTAGDTLDSLVVNELITRAHIGADESLKRRVSHAISLDGIRRLKEQLFITGQLQYRLVTDQVISITLDEFLQSQGVKAFVSTIELALREFLAEVDPSWATAARQGTFVSLILTGGGSQLPMLKQLPDKEWQIGGIRVGLGEVTELPALIRDRFDDDFIREYPQLAVAMGGALPILDERSAARVWAGDAPRPGRLERFPITGN
jgi:hypothetical protein